MKRLGLSLLSLVVSFTAFSQKQDSAQQAQYQVALQHLKQGAHAQAATEFSDLITAGFSNKEVYVKRGIGFYFQEQYEKAKLDFDEAVKARISTAELFEYRGNAKYKLSDYQGAAGDLDKAVTMGSS